MALFEQHYLNKPLSSAMRTWSEGHRGGTQGYNPSTVVTKEMLRNLDWAVPFMMNVGKDKASRLGMTEQEMRQAHNVYRAGGVDAYSTAAINQMVPEPSPIERLLATRDSGSMNGSATVDIDIAGLGQPARNPADLFRPQPLGGQVQMLNVTRPENNPLSFN